MSETFILFETLNDHINCWILKCSQILALGLVVTTNRILLWLFLSFSSSVFLSIMQG
uniref:Uncharacterized protein n=1 Tax=Rhizophora mucronata TaxID=61149 RepID=A0A2P2P165_RHIMU